MSILIIIRVANIVERQFFEEEEIGVEKCEK